jgi:hypothetical protein
MTASNLKRTLLKGPTKLTAIAALSVLLAWFTGGALVERIEKHAAEDRLLVGMTANTCTQAACSSSHFTLD